MKSPVETYKLTGGRVLKIYIDESPSNVRKFCDCLGRFVGAHRRYNIGDAVVRGTEELAYDVLHMLREDAERELKKQKEGKENRRRFAQEAILRMTSAIESGNEETVRKAIEKEVILLNVFMYDHSGVAFSTGSFNDPWDSGQVGVIYVTKEKIRHEYGKRITARTIRRVTKYLEGEIEEYSAWASGDVYGFGVEDKNGEEEDSCWGFFGSNPLTNGISGYLGKKDHAKLRAQLPGYMVQAWKDARKKT